MNDKKDRIIAGYVPWITDEVEEKISSALGTDQLTSLFIQTLSCKAVVANEFLDFLTFYVAEQGLEKLDLRKFAIESQLKNGKVDT